VTPIGFERIRWLEYSKDFQITDFEIPNGGEKLGPHIHRGKRYSCCSPRLAEACAASENSLGECPEQLFRLEALETSRLKD
jgi:hypothetical protein